MKTHSLNIIHLLTGFDDGPVDNIIWFEGPTYPTLPETSVQKCCDTLPVYLQMTLKV